MDCWIYPKHEQCELENIIPKFDHCKTLYTQCDFRLEGCVHTQLLRVEDKLREHQMLVDAEMTLQNKLIDQLWVLSQRYLLLTNSGVCVKPYPEIVSEPTEQRALCEFHIKLSALNLSNCRMSQSLQTIKSYLKEFDHRCDQLDKTVESIFLLGDLYRKPLEYSREIVYDMYHYFYATLCKLKCWAQLIDPGDAGAIEDYIALAKPSDDPKFVVEWMTKIDDCKCMRTNHPFC